MKLNLSTYVFIFLRLLDDYSRMSVNDDKTRKSSTDFTLNVLPSGSPLSTRKYQSSSQTRYSSTSVNSNSPNREQYHSRESSPITTGYASSSTTRTTSTTYQSGVSPAKTYTTQYEHHSVSSLFLFPFGFLHTLKYDFIADQ